MLIKKSVYAWDYRNRLTSVTLHANLAASARVRMDYKYDALDQLVARQEFNAGSSSPAVSQHFVYDPQRSEIALELDDSGTIQHAFLWGPGVDQLLAAADAIGRTSWSISDPHGTIDQWVDSSGNLLAGATLDSFGNPATHSATTPESLDLYFSYTGKYRDPLTGEQYNNARWYDPATGRFLSHDPIEADANSYRYASNDPVNKSDPSGLAPPTSSGRSQTTTGPNIHVRGEIPGWIGFTPTERVAAQQAAQHAAEEEAERRAVEIQLAKKVATREQKCKAVSSEPSEYGTLEWFRWFQYRRSYHPPIDNTNDAGQWEKEYDRTMSGADARFQRVTEISERVDQSIVDQPERMRIAHYRMYMDEQNARARHEAEEIQSGMWIRATGEQARINEYKRVEENMIVSGMGKWHRESVFFLCPATINPSNCNLDNVVTIVGAAAVPVAACRGSRVAQNNGPLPTRPPVTVFHQGDLSSGVSGSRPLSTSTVLDLSHYRPDGQLYRFDIPADVYHTWRFNGSIQTFSDLHAPTGIITPEIRILPPASGDLGNFMVQPGG